MLKLKELTKINKQNKTYPLMQNNGAQSVDV